MLNVLAIYPAFDPAINEMAMVWRNLCQEGRVRCSVIAGSVDTLKGQASTQLVENLTNLDIYRIPAAPTSTEGRLLVADIARKIRPDVIFCAVPHNMPAAIAAQAAVSAPIVLHTEYFLDDTMSLRRRAYLGLEWLRPWVHDQFRQKLQSRCQRILCSNPVEFDGTLPATLAAKFQYLPWPHPHHAEEPGVDRHESNFSAFIGSVSRAKGAVVLQRYFSALLDVNPDFRLSIVGPPTDQAGTVAIKALQAKGGGRVNVRPHCPRAEALDLIGRSAFVLSPANRLGWGLLGDAWSSGTPVITVGRHYDIRADENCLLAADSKRFVENVMWLQQDENLRRKLVDAGYETASRHSIEAVSAALMQGLEWVSPQGHRDQPALEVA